MIVYQNQCFQCTYTDPNCLGCAYEALDSCAICAYGYYLKNSACNKCEADCDYCVGQSQCIKCSNGFWLSRSSSSSTGTCQACDSTCKTCDSGPRVCTSCYDNFTLDGAYCVSVNNIALTTKFDMTFGQFFNILDGFLNWIVTRVNLSRKNSTNVFKSQRVVIKTIVSGSIIIDSSVSLDEAT